MGQQKLGQKQPYQSNGGNAFDPARLGDPIAVRTDWTPARGGGANFRTHKLVKVNSNRVEFRVAIGIRLLFLFMILLGVVFGVGFPVGLVLDKKPSLAVIIPVLLGLIFGTIGGCLLRFLAAPKVFDKRRGFFWKNRKSPGVLSDRKGLTHPVMLSEIHALQLISEYVEGQKGSYYSYELNLVLRNGNRINVIDHGDENRLRKDANTLSAFLEKPVWDAIGLNRDV